MNDDTRASHSLGRPTPQEAEATLREAIAAFDARPVKDDLHTADALAWALRRRQWLSRAEADDLRAHLAALLPGLHGIPRPRLTPSGATDPGKTTNRKRPLDVEILLAHVANSAIIPLAGVLDALVRALTAPAGVDIDGGGLRRALDALTAEEEQEKAKVVAIGHGGPAASQIPDQPSPEEGEGSGGPAAHQRLDGLLPGGLDDPTQAEQQESAQDVVDGLAARLDRAAVGTTGLTTLLADAFEVIAEIFGAEIDTEQLRTAFAVRWPDG